MASLSGHLRCEMHLDHGGLMHCGGDPLRWWDRSTGEFVDFVKRNTPVAVVRSIATGSVVRLFLWCPACDDSHPVNIKGEPTWEWDGNLDAPTISPSIKVTGKQWSEGDAFYRPGHFNVPRGGQTICHSYVRAGRWKFLGDCTHGMAGQTVPLPALPDHLVDDGAPG